MCIHSDGGSLSGESVVAATVTNRLITGVEGAGWGTGELAAAVHLLLRCLAREGALSPGTDGQQGTSLQGILLCELLPWLLRL